jgi:hypothetical protein
MSRFNRTCQIVGALMLLAAFFATAFAEDPKKAPPNPSKGVTFGTQKDKMQSATKNAEATKSLLIRAPKSSKKSGTAVTKTGARK